jgi:PIN domain nuclease of toxin-antitoxin system
MPPAEWWARACEHNAISILLVEPETVIRSFELPWLDRDPVDRNIIATALRANAPVVTSDEHFGAYGVDSIL